MRLLLGRLAAVAFIGHFCAHITHIVLKIAKKFTDSLSPSLSHFPPFLFSSFYVYHQYFLAPFHCRSHIIHAIYNSTEACVPFPHLNKNESVFVCSSEKMSREMRSGWVCYVACLDIPTISAFKTVQMALLEHSKATDQNEKKKKI